MIWYSITIACTVSVFIVWPSIENNLMELVYSKSIKWIHLMDQKPLHFIIGWWIFPEKAFIILVITGTRIPRLLNFHKRNTNQLIYNLPEHGFHEESCDGIYSNRHCTERNPEIRITSSMIRYLITILWKKSRAACNMQHITWIVLIKGIL